MQISQKIMDNKTLKKEKRLKEQYLKFKNQDGDSTI